MLDERLLQTEAAKSYYLRRFTWELFRNPLLTWLAISILTLTFTPDGWKILKERAGVFYDAGNYLTIATQGYISNGHTAFYPVWPLLIRSLSFLEPDPITLAMLASLLSSIFFAASLYFFAKWTRGFRLERFRTLIAWLFILSPLSLFRVLPFTESLFSLLLMLLMCDLCFGLGDDHSIDQPSITTNLVRTLRCGLWAVLLSATRPMFPFLMIATVMIAAIVVWGQRSATLPANVSKRVLGRLLAIFIAAPFGYLPYGLFCARYFGDFWQPFHIQAQWGRVFGLHWELILSPRVINGSDEVLVWDLIAFYLPIFLFIWGLWFYLWRRRSISIGALVGFFMAVLIGCAHSAAAFLTYGRFMSIGRHVLANPLPFLALLIALQNVPATKADRVRGVLGFFAFASAVFLSMWWFRFANDRWIG